MIGTVAGEALASLRASVDGLLEADLSGLSGLEIASLLTLLEMQRRRLDAGGCVGGGRGAAACGGG